jgi:UPF0716 family protein affecting phage T7 exclusion
MPAGNHVARLRVALGSGGFSAPAAGNVGGLIQLAGFLLLIPELMTDAPGLVLRVAPQRRALSAALRCDGTADRGDGMVDLAPEK